MPELPSRILLLLPEFLILLGIAGLGMAGRFASLRMRPGLFYSVAAGLLLTAVLTVPLEHFYLPALGPLRGIWLLSTGMSSSATGEGLLTIDPAGIFFKTFAGLLGLAAIAGRWRLSREEKDETQLPHGFLLGTLGATFGAFLLAGSNDLFLMWGAVEILVRSLRLAGAGTSSHRDGSSRYGGFFSAMTLFGIILLYGLFGTTELFSILKSLSTRNADIVPVNALLAAWLLVFGGILSRLAAAAGAFRDARRGAILSIRIPLFLGLLLCGYTLLFRLTSGIFPPDLHGIRIETFIIVIGSAIGISCALAALGTENLFRGLALSAGAHLGTAVLALAPRSVSGDVAGTTYMALHLFLTLGAVVAIRGIAGGSGEIREMRGHIRADRASGLLPGFLLLSLAGIPFTGGFLSRFFVFGVLVESGRPSLWNVIPGGIISILLLYAHGRWLHALYLRDSRQEISSAARGYFAWPLPLICAVVALGSGVPTGFRLIWNFIRSSLGYPGA